MKLFVSIATLVLLLTSCGSSTSDAFEKGHHLSHWSFESIEPYKEGQKDEEFMKRVKVTPITLGFTKAKETGKFTAFYPNQDFYAADYFISRDIEGKVDFKLNDDKIYVSFEDVRSRGPFKMKNFFIHELNEEHMVFEMGDPSGNLYMIKMKKGSPDE